MMNSKSCTLSVLIGLTVLLPGCAARQNHVAVRPLGQPIETGPVDAQLDHARSMLALNQPGLAIPILREVLRDAPDNADALNCLGVAYDSLGRTDLARRYFEQALAKAPLDQRYANNLTRLMARSQGAEARLADVTTSDPRPDALTAPVPATAVQDESADPAAPRPEIDLASKATEPVAALPQAHGNDLAAASISLPSRGIFSVSMTPFNPGAALPHPRQLSGASRLTEQGTPPLRLAGTSHIQRLSLGEVRLVTIPAKPVPAVHARSTANRKSPGYWASLEQWLRSSALLERLGAARRAARLVVLEQSLARIKAYIAEETSHDRGRGASLSQATSRTETHPS